MSENQLTPPNEVHELCSRELRDYIKDYASYLKKTNDPDITKKVSDKIYKIEKELRLFSKYGQYVLDCCRD